MLRTVFQSEQPSFQWADLVNPTPAELQAVAERYGLHAIAVKDCLDPEHLPKFERFDGTSFLILRAYDERADAAADTIQSFTRKVAVFYGQDFLLTVHRKDQPYLQQVESAWTTPAGQDRPVLPDLLIDLVNAVILSYDRPLTDAERGIDAFETGVFRARELASMLRDIYVLKRRVTLAKRLLWRTLSISTRFQLTTDRHAPLFQDLRENAESMHFWADELLDDVNNLLSMQISLASQRTNEVVQVLTIFSAFFLPLTFLVGVYGMNFHFMPELSQRWGYPLVWSVMVAISLGIYLWFKRRGWL